MPQDRHDPEIAGLEAALAALAPLPGRLDRDQLLFRAGQASVPRAGWAWPYATAVLGAVAAVLAGALVLRPLARPVERIVHVPQPAPAHPLPPPVFPPEVEQPPGEEDPPPAEPPPPVSEDPDTARTLREYHQLRRQVLRWGLDGVPSLPAAPPRERAGKGTSPPGTPAYTPARPGLLPLETLFNLGGGS